MQKVTQVNDETNKNDFKNNARYVAVRLLSRFERSDSYIDKLLDHEYRNSELSSLDKSLLTEIVNGVIRWRGKLDWILTGFYHGEYQKCLNLVKNAMRVALYQILFLNKIPTPSAINESVEIVKQIQGEKTAGIVNAVLRNIVRNSKNIRYPDRKNDVVYHFATIYSHPKWMVKRWLNRYGVQETEKLLIANNQRPGTTYRVNTNKIERSELFSLLEEQEILSQVSQYHENSFVVRSKKGSLVNNDLFKNGLITIQDTSASLASSLARLGEGETMVDLCAAPGGKSFFIAGNIKDTGKIIAVEKYSSKLRLIEEGKKRLGLDSIQTITADARTYTPKEPVDVVFADVPCSGLGTLSKKPDIKWKKDSDDLRKLVQTQRDILVNASKIVKKGGAVIYSTCTIEPEENEDNIKWFLEENPDFELDPADKYLPAEICRDGYMSTLPHQHNIDGAFAARLVRKKD